MLVYNPDTGDLEEVADDSVDPLVWGSTFYNPYDTLFSQAGYTSYNGGWLDPITGNWFDSSGRLFVTSEDLPDGVSVPDYLTNPSEFTTTETPTGETILYRAGETTPLGYMDSSGTYRAYEYGTGTGTGSNSSITTPGVSSLTGALKNVLSKLGVSDTAATGLSGALGYLAAQQARESMQAAAAPKRSEWFTKAIPTDQQAWARPKAPFDATTGALTTMRQATSPTAPAGATAQTFAQTPAQKAARPFYNAPTTPKPTSTPVPAPNVGTTATPYYNVPTYQNISSQINSPKGYAMGGLARYVRGGTAGQDDKIPALLSDGEYVMDADVVSALGDGNNEAGAAKLDKMRENIRRHKRAASAKSIPPKAKSPEQYLKGSK